MSFSGFGGQFYSISHSGSLLFQQSPIKSTAGGVVIDLVSAPIEPGDYQLEINVTIGGIEIFLPHYVQFTLEGGTIAGGRDVHEGPDMWHKIKKKLHKQVNLPDQPPDYALADSNPERPVRIRFTIRNTAGGVDIYRV